MGKGCKMIPHLTSYLISMHMHVHMYAELWQWVYCSLSSKYSNATKHYKNVKRSLLTVIYIRLWKELSQWVVKAQWMTVILNMMCTNLDKLQNMTFRHDCYTEAWVGFLGLANLKKQNHSSERICTQVYVFRMGTRIPRWHHSLYLQLGKMLKTI